MNKKRWVFLSTIWILVFVSLLVMTHYMRIVFARIEVVLVNDLDVEFLDDKKVSDYIKYINGNIIDDYKIDTTSIGIKNISFKYINDDGIKVNYSYNVNVVDRVSPVIWVSGIYTVLVGSDINLVDSIMCGDNEDPSPVCYIEGNYDLNVMGDYDLVFRARDRSGNESNEKFILRVVSEKKEVNRDKYTNFSDIYNKYNSNKVKVGLDISKWQGDVDFNKVIKSGVSFVVLKIGNTDSDTNGIVVDPRFMENIKKLRNKNIDVYVYFYSRAGSRNQAIKEARWVVNNISNYNIKGVAFDWENWSTYNSYNLSFYQLSDMASGFLDIVNNNGYEAYLYSSKIYLEKIWLPINKYYTWLAHYTDNTDYKGEYKIWQLCDNGKIDGIDGYVDIDIMYMK